MKLAIITSHPIQYYAPWFRHITRATSCDVKIFYLWDFGTRKQHDPKFQQDIEWDIPLTEGYEFSFVENVASDPGTHHFMGMNNPALIDELFEFGPDAILLFGYNFYSMLKVILSRKLAGVPLILRGDSTLLAMQPGPHTLIKHLLLSILFKRFSAFLYVGKANREYYLKYGVPERKLFFAPHSVDNDRFFSAATQDDNPGSSWRAIHGIDSEETVVMFAGKFEQKKRPQLLAQAFRSIKQPDVRLVFVGGGELQPELEALASSDNRVLLVPFQNQCVMPEVLAAADLIVLPSAGPHETWGLVVNEALCMRTPVIVSDHVGCAADLVNHGENGLIFVADDVQSLTQCISEAISDTQRLAEWGSQGKEIISTYSYAETSQGLLDALRVCAEEDSDEQ